jgi:hypothetical protein
MANGEQNQLNLPGIIDLLGSQSPKFWQTKA